MREDGDDEDQQEVQLSPEQKTKLEEVTPPLALLLPLSPLLLSLPPSTPSLPRPPLPPLLTLSGLPPHVSSFHPSLFSHPLPHSPHSQPSERSFQIHAQLTKDRSHLMERIMAIGKGSAASHLLFS